MQMGLYFDGHLTALIDGFDGGPGARGGAPVASYQRPTAHGRQHVMGVNITYKAV